MNHAATVAAPPILIDIMDLNQLLKQHLQAAFKALFDHDLAEDQIGLQPTRKEFEGTHTFVVFPFLKVTRKNPQESAEMIGNYLVEHAEEVDSYNVVKGFLNISFSQAVWLKLLQGALANPHFGQGAPKGKKVLVEYSSPNTNKPLHLGHLRNNFLGYSVAKILEAAGYETSRCNLVNDRGIHICKSMLAYERFGQGETPESSGIKGDHLVGKYYVAFDKAYKQEMTELMKEGMLEDEAKKEASILKEAQEMLKKWEEGDEATVALWKKMNGWVFEGFDASYKTMGVDFDKYYYESNTYLLGKDIIDEGLQKGVFYKRDDGSVWCDLSSEGLDEKLVLRSDGTSVYMTQDMGTADLKFADFGAEKSIYVVGNEQDYHFKVLFGIMDKLGRDYAPGMYHLSYGMVDLPSGKMKSREGTVVDADDIMQEMKETAQEHTKDLGKIEDFDEEQLEELFQLLGMGALKFFLLKVDPKKRMLFNPAESVDFHGHTGPFVQYTHARISAIMRRAEQLGLGEGAVTEGIGLHPTESDLITLLLQFPEKVESAAAEYSPSHIAAFAYDVARAYNRFYAEVSIFNEEDEALKKLRVALSGLTARTIFKAMSLLGITCPDRM